MLKLSGLLAALTAVFLAPVPGGEPASEARTTVDRAIKAMGGQDKLAKLPATTFKLTATPSDPNNQRKEEMSGTMSMLFPDKYRAELTRVGPNNMPENATLVIDGDKAWAFEAKRNTTEEAPEEVMAVMKAALTAVHLAHRLVPLTEKGYELAPLPETKVDGTAAVGVKVTHKGQPDMELYFDKDTNLPVRIEFKIKQPRMTEESTMTFSFSDYKEVGGLKHFTKIVMQMDGKAAMTMEVSDVKRLEKLDAKLFDKP